MPLFCFHDYGKWSKLSGGKKRRYCKKCKKKRVKNASAWDQFWCSHRYRKNKRQKLNILTCKKCAKEKEGKTR
jgi:RNase P subunit RPR2